MMCDKCHKERKVKKTIIGRVEYHSKNISVNYKVEKRLCPKCIELLYS
jgi:hypothetical protein